MMKEKKLPSTYSACMEHYNNFHIQQAGVPPDINALSGKSLKGIINYLTKTVIKQDDDGITAAFKFILDQYPLWDKFYQNQLKLNQIHSNLTNIIKNIKDGKKSTSKYDQSKYR
jgi:hypothetical protein